MTQIRILGEILDIFAELRIPHMIVGSFASGFHGEFRATQDADLVIDPTPEQLDALLERVSSDFYVSPEAAREALSRRGQFNLVHFDTAWKIDLIIRKERPFSREEFARRREENLGGQQVPINSPEDVILAKLEWAKASGSTRQIDDAAAVIAAWGDALDWDYIDHWAHELSVEDLLAQVRSPISGSEG
ncbi:MAG: hypothetical protein ACYC33_00335 [Thermoleophilia bacterium]